MKTEVASPSAPEIVENVPQPDELKEKVEIAK